MKDWWVVLGCKKVDEIAEIINKNWEKEGDLMVSEFLTYVPFDAVSTRLIKTIVKACEKSCQWLIAQLVERSLTVMKDPGSNLGEDICSFRY